MTSMDQNKLLSGRLTRRTAIIMGAALAGAAFPVSLFAKGQQSLIPAATPVADQAAAILAVAEHAMAEMDLRAVILHVTVDGDTVISRALGESLTGMPATTDMHFRNGAAAISYVST